MSLVVFLVGLILTQNNKFQVLPLPHAHRVDTLRVCAFLLHPELALRRTVLVLPIVVAQDGGLLLRVSSHACGVGIRPEYMPWATIER